MFSRISGKVPQWAGRGVGYEDITSHTKTREAWRWSRWPGEWAAWGAEAARAGQERQRIGRTVRGLGFKH